MNPHPRILVWFPVSAYERFYRGTSFGNLVRMTDQPAFSLLRDLHDLPDLDDTARTALAKTFFDRIATRHTIRNFLPDPVPMAVIEHAIAAAGRAPSGANHQPWHFAVVQSPEVKRRIREAAEEEERAFYSGRAGDEWLDALAPIGTDANKPFLETAPFLIAVFAQRRGGVDTGDDRKNYYINESVGIATGFLIAALHEAGLGTLTHTPNPMAFLNTSLNRPLSEKPFVLLVVGKPAPDASVPHHALKKKALADIMSIF